MTRRGPRAPKSYGGGGREGGGGEGSLGGGRGWSSVNGDAGEKGARDNPGARDRHSRLWANGLQGGQSTTWMNRTDERAYRGGDLA